MTIHKSVLLSETIELLNLKTGMIVVDATLGGGGHSQEVIKKIGKDGKLVAIDADADAIERFKSKIKNQKSKIGGDIFLIHNNFANLKNILVTLKIEKVDAILADLGISSDQLEDKRRGMSFQEDAPLDMRMNQAKEITAAEIINNYAEDKLIKILQDFSDEKYARSIIKNIVAYRQKNKIERVLQLVGIIEQSVPGEYKRKKIHFATKTFQALRMEVNREIESLDSFLSQAVEVLQSGGRLAIIAFHSGEDSLVKKTFRENARGCICPPEFPVCRCHKKPIIKLITRKPITPSVEEINENPRARSAKLRVIEKI
jgi:16S rRNA (cytosine1402-N4)-methyltransferase